MLVEDHFDVAAGIEPATGLISWTKEGLESVRIRRVMPDCIHERDVNLTALISL